jgi:diacylglycerol O-acyltransferase / wax synthase
MSTRAQLETRQETLSRADLTWLNSDEPTNHFVVTSLVLFDEPLAVEHVKSMLASRIALHPRLRQVVSRPFIQLGTPRWTAASNFDLDAHINPVALPRPAGFEELARYIDGLVGRPLDFGRPLWECHVVEGPGTGGALITRFHHSIGDGQAMVRMLLTLTDEAADGWRRPAPRQRRVAKRGGSATSLNSHFARRLPDLPRLAVQGVRAVGTLARLTLLDADRPTSLRGELTLLKRVAWTEPLSLAAIKRIAHASGATLNDVIVSVIAGSLGDYLRRAGEDTRGLRIRAMVPVNLRPAGDSAMSGNRFSLIYLELPLGVTDPYERLMRVKIEMDRIKASMEPSMGWLLVVGLGLLPPRLEHMTAAFYARKATLVLTNVLGPQQRLYLAGSPIRQMTFWEPESGGLGLGVSIYSYAGEVTVGVVSDRNVVRSPRELTDGVVRGLAELSSRIV